MSESKQTILEEFKGNLNPPANNGQAVIFLTQLLEVFIYEISFLATVSDNSIKP